MQTSEIENVEIIGYPVHVDDRGSLHEYINMSTDSFLDLNDAQPRNFYCSVTDPLVVKAFHFHNKQTDFFFAAPNSAKTMVVLYDK